MIPAWICTWVSIPIAITAAAVMWSLTQIGQDDGAGVAWLLFGLVGCSVGLLWWRGYDRRCEASAILSEQALYRQSEIEKIDDMTGAAFEQYCAVLLKVHGYRNVVVTGSTDGDHGVDIAADSPNGVPVGVQCKRWKSSIGPDVVRELLGATRAGRHQGRAPMLISSARATPRAHKDAAEEGVEVVDRGRLQEWILDAREQIEQRRGAATGKAIGSPGGMGLAGQILTTVLCGVLVILILTAFPIKLPRIAPQPRSSARPSASAAVVEKLFAAINRHNWPTVWRLWYHRQPGYGPRYHRTIAGFRLTRRDVAVTGAPIPGLACGNSAYPGWTSQQAPP